MQRGTTAERFQQIELERIDLEDKSLAVAFPQELDEGLLASVRESGVFLPAILQQGEHGLFRLVAGHRRIPAAKMAGMGSVPARIVGRGMTDKALFLLNVTENTVTRGLNDIERAVILHRLIEDSGMEDKEIMNVMPLLGLASSQRVLNQYLALVGLIPELQRYVVDRSIPIRVGSRMAAWPEEDQRTLQDLLEKVQITGNTLNEILDLLEELSLREGTAVSTLFLRAEVREVLAESGWTPTQKREKLKQRLRTMRYPLLSTRTEKISELLRRGGAHPGLFLDPPAYLEGNALRVSFSFESMKELQQKAEGLLALASREEIEEVLRLIQARKDG